MRRIKYVRGDAAAPVGDGRKVILHVCNDLGGWGAGFVLALSRRWPEPEAAYRTESELTLGEVQLVQVEPDLWVANMIAQHGFPRAGIRRALDLDALERCLRFVADVHAGVAVSFHGPRFGCGIAGGLWSDVEPLIERTLCHPGAKKFVGLWVPLKTLLVHPDGVYPDKCRGPETLECFECDIDGNRIGAPPEKKKRSRAKKAA